MNIDYYTMGIDFSNGEDYSCINVIKHEQDKKILLEHKIFKPNSINEIEEYKQELRNKYKGLIEIR